MAADRVRAPQARDLLAHPSLDLLLLRDPERPVLELFQQRADPPQVLDDRAPLRLGGVRGQHGRDAEVAHRRRIRVERGDRIADRFPRAAPFAQGPDAMALLGQVDQLEVARERPDHVLGSVQVERRDQFRHAPPAGGRRAAPVRDRGLAQRLDLIQQLGAAALRDRIAEHRRQHPDVPPEFQGSGALAPASAAGLALGHPDQPLRASGLSRVGGRSPSSAANTFSTASVPHRVARVDRGAPQVGDHDDVLEFEQPLLDLRLAFEHVEAGGEDLAGCQRVGERASSTTGPREVFTRTAVGFIA